jgi:hypothetical protein
MRQRLGIAVAFAVPFGCFGCAHHPWEPPPPTGFTYEYEYQGFAQKNRGGYGGTNPAFAIGGGFSVHGRREVHGERGADPFAQATPIDGLTFNEHLAGRGIVVTPAPALQPPQKPPTP